MSELRGEDRVRLAELEPLLRRAVGLDPRSLVRLRLREDAATALVRLPFGVLVSRTVHVPPRDATLDVALQAAEVLTWLEASSAAQASDDAPSASPQPRDAQWRTGLPPPRGWVRVETVPDDVVRPLVRSGALTLKDAAAREGVPGAQPRAEVADALLDSVVLTASDAAGRDAPVTLRALSALTRMGFLRRDGQMHIDVSGRWIRVVGEYGSVFLERPGSELRLT